MTGPRYSCIESFCGAGGLSLGLERAGFRILTAFDANQKAVETYNAYRGEPRAFVADARLVRAENLVKRAGLSKSRRLDLFSGGPPCQGYSIQKKGAHLDDPRNALVLEYARLVKDLRPRFFLLENVGMFGRKRGEPFLKTIRELLNEYELFPHFYNSADYGVAQTRERFIVVGKHADVQAAFRVPAPTVTRWLTVGEALGDLPQPKSDFSDHPDYPNHKLSKMMPENIVRFSFVPQGGGREDIPDDLQLPCHKRVNFNGGSWKDVYGRLEWNGYAPTITAGCDTFTRGRFGHPTEDRTITPREAARLQGFPDDYVFMGNRVEQCRQIGNAVPPPLAWAIGCEIVRSLMTADGLPVKDAPTLTHDLGGKKTVSELIHFDTARKALALATSIDEVKIIRDKASALQQYMRQARESLEMQNECAEIKIRAERRAGEILQAMDKNVGGRPSENPSHDVTGFQRPPSLPELGISRMQSHRWQAIADIPADDFERHIATAKVRKEELTTASTLELAKKIRKLKEQSENLEAAGSVEADTHPRATSDIRMGDFREALKDIAEESVALVITELVHSPSESSIWRDLGRFASKALRDGGSLVVITDQHSLPHALAGLSEYLNYVWLCSASRRREEPVYPVKIRSSQIPVLLFAKGKYRADSWMADILDSPGPNSANGDEPETSHGMRYLIEHLTGAGDLVCDPLMNSKTTCVMAGSLQRRFIGCESLPVRK